MLGRFLAVKEWSKVIRQVERERRSPGERDGISTSNKTRQVAETFGRKERRALQRCCQEGTPDLEGTRRQKPLSVCVSIEKKPLRLLLGCC
jgi:hypothetical protein